MGIRPMDKLDFCLIPLVYFLRMNFTTLSVATLLVPTPSTIERALKNGAKWTAIYLPPSNYFSFIRDSQPNKNINTSDRAEFCSAILNGANLSVLAEVLFQSFQIKI